jgi:O-antigen/teichoic acid export membrane protein
MTVFSSYIFLNIITEQITWNVDKFIIGRFWGTVDVAVYGLAALLNSYYISLSSALSNVFIPRVNRMVNTTNDNGELTGLFTRIGRIQFITLSLICTGFIFFGQPFIRMWAGKEYDGAYIITVVLIVSVTIVLIQNIGIEIQKAKNMHKFRSFVYFVIAIGNVCLSIPLTKMYGPVGAAAGTAAAMVIGGIIIMNLYYDRRVGLDISYFWSQIISMLPALAIPIISGIIFCRFLDLANIVVFLVAGMAYVTIYSGSFWFLGMNDYEKNLIREPLLRLKLAINKKRNS